MFVIELYLTSVPLLAHLTIISTRIRGEQLIDQVSPKQAKQKLFRHAHEKFKNLKSEMFAEES